MLVCVGTIQINLYYFYGEKVLGTLDQLFKTDCGRGTTVFSE